MKRIDAEMIGFGQRTQVGKSSSRASEPPRHEINIVIQGTDKDMLGFGQGTQVWKEAPRNEINTARKINDGEIIGLGQGTQIGTSCSRCSKTLSRFS